MLAAFASLLEGADMPAGNDWLPAIRLAVERVTKWGYRPWEGLDTRLDILEFIEENNGVSLGYGNPVCRMILSRARGYHAHLQEENRGS